MENAKQLMGALKDLMQSDLPGKPIPSDLYDVLFQVWPETSEGVRGNAVMLPEDAKGLEQLFRLFGVPMKIEENSLSLVKFAYEVFGVALPIYVSLAIRMPESFRRRYAHWPADWLDYIEAAAQRNEARTRELAKKLQPLSPDCVFPEDTYLYPYRP